MRRFLVPALAGLGLAAIVATSDPSTEAETVAYGTHEPVRTGYIHVPTKAENDLAGLLGSKFTVRTWHICHDQAPC